LAAAGVASKDGHIRHPFHTVCPAQKLFTLLSPQVRRAALAAVSHLFAASQTALPALQKLVIDFLGQVLTPPDSSKDSTVVHGLSVLRELYPFLPISFVRSSFDTLGRLLQLGNSTVSMLVFTALQSLFSAGRADGALPSEALGRALEVLLRHQPVRSDVGLRGKWNAVVSVALSQTTRADPSLVYDILPLYVSSCYECYLGDKGELAGSATTSLSVVLAQAVPPIAAQLRTTLEAAGDNKAEIKAAKKSPAGQALRALSAAVAGGLQYRYQACYPHVLKVLGTLFTGLGELANGFLGKTLVELAELHETEGVRCTGDIETCIGSAVAAMGPDLVLRRLPLDLDAGDGLQRDFPRAWLLPVLADSVCNTQLGYFAEAMLPMAQRMGEMEALAEGEEKEVLAKAYRQLRLQVWALLPGFCKGATDLAESFPHLARTIGDALAASTNNSQEVPLRNYVCRALINSAKTAQKADAASRSAVARFAKNFFPLLFNACMAESNAEHRLPILEAVATLADIADDGLVTGFFKTVVAKMLAAEESTDKEDLKTRHVLMDLALALAPGMEPEALGLLYRLLRPQLKSTDNTLQKKSYKALLFLCGNENPAVQAFVAERLADMAEMLAETTLTATPGSKAARMRCIHSVLDIAPPELLAALSETLTAEIMLGTKEANEKARAAAYDVLVLLGDRLVEVGRGRACERRRGKGWGNSFLGGGM
jgi:ribosomal RNA-processing protein 12